MQEINYSVFYAEDDQDDQTLFKDAIRKINAPVDLHIQNDGVELLHQLENPPPTPKLVFLDINMPRKNGIQVLQELRASDKHNDVPVIIFTTSDDNSVIDLTKTLGAKAFITKPQFYPKYIEAIKHCLAVDWQNFTAKDKPYVLSFS